MNHDTEIAAAALAIAEQIERDKVDVSDNDQQIALTLIKHASKYRDLLAPFDGRADIPHAVTLTPGA